MEDKKKFEMNNSKEYIMNKKDREKMEKCLCTISIPLSDKYTNGFFFKFPFLEEDIYLKGVLINYDIFKDNNNDNLTGLIDIILPNTTKMILLDESRQILKFREFNIIFIELKAEDNINDFLELDCNLKQEDDYLKEIYCEDSFFNFKAKEEFDVILSYGIFSEEDKSKFFLPFQREDSKGLPILSPQTFKVIGIHCGKSEATNFSKGTFIKFAKIVTNNYKSNKKRITINKNIDKNTINLINILYKICDNNNNINNKLKIFDKEFVKNNKENFRIIIGEKEQELCSEIQITEKLKNKKELEIKLKQINLITNLGNMFAHCLSLISLSNLSNLDTSEVENFENIFFGCSSLKFFLLIKYIIFVNIYI